ncbi:MAG: GNAT family N-acetyltransferase [Beijerinckiaceae bacterium]
MTLAFRPLDPAGKTELIELWADSWSEVYAGIDFHARKPWFDGHIDSWLAKGGDCICGFAEDGVLAGFLLIHRGDGHLDQICARRDLKGAGVGGALIAEAKRLCPSGLSLDVNLMNARAIRFYEREGFAKTGEGVNPTSGLPIAHYRWRL